MTDQKPEGVSTDIELLPLPGKEVIDVHEPTGIRVYGYNYQSMEAYARANVAHTTAAKDAEIDALRTRLEDTVRDSTNKIEALREELREAWSAVDSKAGWEWKKRAEQADAQAEQLAEALRKVDEQLDDVECECPAGIHAISRCHFTIFTALAAQQGGES